MPIALCTGARPEPTEAELRGAGQLMWLDRLETEHGNLGAALSWLADAGQLDQSVRLIWATWRFWWMRGHADELARFEEVLVADGSGLPPSAARIVSPYDLAARYSRRGQVTRWTGYLAHVTETCSDDGPNVITDVDQFIVDYRRYFGADILFLPTHIVHPTGHRVHFAFELTDGREVVWGEGVVLRARKATGRGSIMGKPSKAMAL